MVMHWHGIDTNMDLFQQTFKVRDTAAHQVTN